MNLQDLKDWHSQQVAAFHALEASKPPSRSGDCDYCGRQVSNQLGDTCNGCGARIRFWLRHEPLIPADPDFTI